MLRLLPAGIVRCPSAREGPATVYIRVHTQPAMMGDCFTNSSPITSGPVIRAHTARGCHPVAFFRAAGEIGGGGKEYAGVPSPHGDMILYVEDDIDTRDAVSFALEEHGYAVFGAANGQT